MFKKLFAAACIVAAAGSAQAQNVPVDSNFLTATIPWDRSGKITLSVGVRETAAGELVLCGAWASFGGPTFSRLNRQLLDRSRIVAGNVVLSRNMSFFNQVSNAYVAQEMVGAATNCVNTGKPINQVDFTKFELDIYEGPYRDR